MKKGRKLMTFIKTLRIAYRVLCVSARAIRRLLKALENLNQSKEDNL